MSDSVQPHRWQPTRLPHPWDSPGKNTGVGCHFLLQCMKVKSESEVAQSCPTLRDPMDCSLPGSSTHGIFQARVLEWGAIALSVWMSSMSKFELPKRSFYIHPLNKCYLCPSFRSGYQTLVSSLILYLYSKLSQQILIIFSLYIYKHIHII